LASLAGLEQALEQADQRLIENAVRRINLLRSIMLSAGGIPLIYLGDEWGALNDYTYLSDPAKAGDSRWVHRSKRRWEARDDLTDADTLEWRFYNELVKLIGIRKTLAALYNGGMQVVDAGNPHLFAYARQHHARRVLMVNNFSDNPQRMPVELLKEIGFGNGAADLVSGRRLAPGAPLDLDGYRYVWLDPQTTL
jgi:amylosucrase